MTGLDSRIINERDIALPVFGPFRREATILFRRHRMSVELRRVYPSGNEAFLGRVDRIDMRRWLADPHYHLEFNDVGLIVDHTINTEGRLGFLFQNSLWILEPPDEHLLHKFL